LSKLDVTSAEMFKAFRLVVLKEPDDDDVLELSCLAAVDDDGGSISTAMEDSELVMDLFENMNMWLAMMEYSRCFGVTPYKCLACGQQARCLSIVYILASDREFVLDHPTSMSLI
jgi:hypothetical protein